MSYKITQAVNPGIVYTIPLTQGVNTNVVRIWNGTPFDLDYRGLGSADITVIVAGTGVEFKSKDFNDGKIVIIPFNNNNVSGTGIVNITVYNIGDAVPEGTFPVAIPVQVVQAVVTSASTLSNENSSLGTKIIDVGLVGNTDLFDLFNDHFVWKVLQGGVVHTVLQGQTSNNPLVCGQAGDTTEIVGTLQVDGQTATGAVGAITNGTSGTITFITPIWGTGDKKLWVWLNGYINNAIVSFTFPSVVNVGKIKTGNWGSNTVTCTLFRSGSSIQVRCLTALAATGGGTITSETNIYQNSEAYLPSGGADQIQFGTTTGAITSFIEITGV